jgi:hypothetical protein
MDTIFIYIVLVSSAVILITPSLLYLVLFRHIKADYELFLSPFITSIISLFTLTLLYELASETECKKKNFKNSLSYAVKPSVFIILIYYIIIFLPSLINPIIELTKPIGHNQLFNRIGIGYYMMLGSWGPTIIGYFKIIKDNCVLDKEIVDNYKKEIWSGLVQRGDKDPLKTTKIA